MADVGKEAWHGETRKRRNRRNGETKKRSYKMKRKSIGNAQSS